MEVSPGLEVVTPPSAASLVILMDDENPVAVSAAIQFATTLFRNVLRLLVQETNPINAQKLVGELKLLKDKVLHILMTRKNHIGVQLRAIKFLEMLVLCFTTADHERKAGDTFSLEDVPVPHLVLSPPALAREALDYLSALIQQVRDSGTCAGAMATINSLCSLIHHRGSLAPNIIPALTRLSDSLPDFSPAQVTSLKHTLANALQSINKLSYASGYSEMIANSLNDLGLSGSSRRSGYKKSDPRPDMVPSDGSESQPPPGGPIGGDILPSNFPPSAPFASVPPPTSSVFPPPMIPPTPAEPISPDVISNLLLDNMAKLPPTPPPPNEPLPPMDVQNLIAFFAVLTQQVLQRQNAPAAPPVRLDPRRDPRLMSAGIPPSVPPSGPAPTPVATPVAVPAYGSMGGQPPMAMPTGSALAPMVPPGVSMNVPPTLAPIGIPTAPAPAAVEIPKVAVKQEPPKLRIPTLSTSQLTTLNNLAYDRIIECEDDVRIGGGSKLRQSLLVRLASLRSLDDPCIRHLLDHIAENCYNRHELAVSLLYQEYVNAKHVASALKIKKPKLDIEAPIKTEKMEETTSDDMEGKEKESESETKNDVNNTIQQGGDLEEDDREKNPMARYEFFINEILAILKDKLDFSDGQFTQFLLDAPELPESAIMAVKAYCEDEKRVVLGLDTLRDLILQRVPYRTQCLQILLTYTIHIVEFIRSAAINLTANQLFLERPTLEDAIEHFAFESLQSMVEVMQEKAKSSAQEESVEEGEGETKEDGAKEMEKEKISETEKKMEVDEVEKEADGEEGKTQPSRKRKRGEEKTVGSTEANGIDEEYKEEEDSEENYIRRHLLLAFSLCARKHSLLAQLVQSYCIAPVAVKKEMHKQTSGLIKTIGMDSPHFLQLVSQCPKGSDTFILQALHILTEQTIPSAQLVAIVKAVYQKRNNDARFMIPILSGLNKDETLDLLPTFLNLPSNILKNVIHRILHNKPTPLTPEELLVALHTLDPQKDKVPLRKVIEAIQLCFNQKAIYKQQIMAVVLQQLVDVLPIPPLFMRTVIKAITAFPKMMGFIMGILSRLITKQVWNDKTLWKGFVECVKIMQPHSCPVVLQLPPQQIADVLDKLPALKTPLLQLHEENPSPNMTLALQHMEAT